MWIYSNNPDQVIWLAVNKKWAWQLNLFSRTRVKSVKQFFSFSPPKHVTHTHWKCLTGMLLMRTHNITFCGKKNKKDIYTVWLKKKKTHLICKYDNIVLDKVGFFGGFFGGGEGQVQLKSIDIDIFLISPRKHMFRYSLEAPHRSMSNEYPRHVSVEK